MKNNNAECEGSQQNQYQKGWQWIRLIYAITYAIMYMVELFSIPEWSEPVSIVLYLIVSIVMFGFAIYYAIQQRKRNERCFLYIRYALLTLILATYPIMRFWKANFG